MAKNEQLHVMVLPGTMRKLREIGNVHRRKPGMQVSVLVEEAHKAMFPEEYDDFLPEGMTEVEYEAECRR